MDMSVPAADQDKVPGDHLTPLHRPTMPEPAGKSRGSRISPADVEQHEQAAWGRSAPAPRILREKARQPAGTLAPGVGHLGSVGEFSLEELSQLSAGRQPRA
jgi:hypothetical protein